MAFASISVLGLYTWNDELFDNLVLPEGMSRDVLIPELVTECSDFPLLYPDYDFMKMLIGVWSTKELSIWQAMFRSENFEYNPIENYDRYEEISREVEGSSSGSASNTRQASGSTSGESKESSTAYNSVTFQETNKTNSTGSSSESGSDSGESSTESSGSETVSSHMHGNIGVTTAQQMIEGYRAVSDFCTYDFIIKSFKNRFCIQVY